MAINKIIVLLNRTKLALYFICHASQYLEKESYYKDSDRKSKFVICFDFLRTIFKYGEIDKFYFVYGLDRKGAVVSDYMPYGRFMYLRERMNQVRLAGQTAYSYACLLRDKKLFNLIADNYNIPIPRTIGIALGGVIKSDFQSIEVDSYLAQMPEGKSLFLKDESGICGRGAMSIDKKDGCYYLNDKVITQDGIVKALSTKTSYLVQERVIQHPLVNAIYPRSLNTLRVVSVIYEGNVVVLGALLRIGAHGNVVDNWASGGLAVGVESEGKLMKWGLFKPGYGTKTDRHPDTGTIFEGYQLPFWEETLQLVKETHIKLSCIPTVGWDIALTKNGPIVIEGNDDYDGALLQACTGGKRKEFIKFYS